MHASSNARCGSHYAYDRALSISAFGIHTRCTFARDRCGLPGLPSQSLSRSQCCSHMSMLVSGTKQLFSSRLYANGAAGSSGEPEFDAFELEALREAARLLQEAQELAERQTRQDLMQSWRLSNADDRAAASSSDPLAGVTTPWDAATDLASSSEASPAPDAALENFWVEQGLSASQAARLVAGFSKAGGRPSTAALAAKMRRLTRVLPGTVNEEQGWTCACTPMNAGFLQCSPCRHRCVRIKETYVCNNIIMFLRVDRA